MHAADGSKRTAGPRWWQRPGAVLLVVALVATLVRLGFVAEVHDHLYWLTPQVDAADFHDRAMQVADGLGIGQRVYYKAPAYPFLVGQLYRIVGPSLVALYIVQMLGGVLLAVVTAALGLWAWGPRVGLGAGLLVATYSELAYFENQALIEAPALVLTVLATALLLWSLRAAKSSTASGWRRRFPDAATVVGLVLAGTLLGVALQMRPINAFLVFGLAAWLLWQPRPFGERLRHAIFLLAPVLLLLIPTLRHNRLGSGEIVPISANGGINFYIGNNANYDDTVAIRPGLRWEELTLLFGANLDPARWQRNYYNASWQWMRTHPGDYAALLCKKFVMFWNVRTIDRNQDSSVLRRESWTFAAGIPWGVQSGLGLVGLVLGWRGARRWPVHVAVLAQMIGVMAFFVTTRYRLAVVPWLALATAWGVAHLLHAVRQRDRRTLAIAGVVVAAVAVLVLPDYHGIGASSYARPHFDLAQVQLRNGQREAALASFRLAAQHRPDDPDVMLWYAEHLDRMGHADEAMVAHVRAVELMPGLYKPALSLGAAFLDRGDLDQAWTWLQASAQRGDTSGRTQYNLALVRERQKRYEEALELHRQSLQFDAEVSDRARARLGVARCLLRLGRGPAALADLTVAASLSREVDFQLDVAAAWIEAKRPTEALAILDPIVQRAPNGKAWSLQARALALLGRMPEALSAAQKALQAEPDNARFQALWQALEREQPATEPR